ncbi:MAG: AAA family ATPase [Tannerellaceae bacterium]|jgi:predicted ATP-dependent endonuclease of OLD family|nr:AAA family ATPase [Tannerellaceae bacterium]
MATITIKNVGPIKSIENLELNKVNVFMGPQSCGKSTVAKIISFCTWVEKRRMLDGFFRENFYDRFKSFHNLEDIYFPIDAYFKYEGDYCDIEFSKRKKTNAEIIVRKDVDFENRKQIYIPAERNFVATVPNLGRYKETNNNILDFLYYWFEAKKSYSNGNTLDIPELGIYFRRIEEEDKDVVIFGEQKEISLQNASSGIQSMLPLYVLIDYLTRVLYEKQIVLSPLELSGKYGDDIHKLRYAYSQFIIEEPEQNLFPSTQRDLIYYMLRVINESERNHRLTFTTHSPYILYALNNCMMGYLVNDQLSTAEKEEYLKNNFSSHHSWIDPKAVSIWEITNEGTLRYIQDKDNIISENYFDRKMTELTDEYFQMLSYYKDEE